MELKLTSTHLQSPEFSLPERVVICFFIWHQTTIPFLFFLGSCFSSKVVILQGVSNAQAADPLSRVSACDLVTGTISRSTPISQKWIPNETKQ